MCMGLYACVHTTRRRQTGTHTHRYTLGRARDSARRIFERLWANDNTRHAHGHDCRLSNDQRSNTTTTTTRHEKWNNCNTTHKRIHTHTGRDSPDTSEGREIERWTSSMVCWFIYVFVCVCVHGCVWVKMCVCVCRGLLLARAVTAGCRRWSTAGRGTTGWTRRSRT